MTTGDIIQVHNKLPGTKIIAVHIDTVNHCFIKRTDLLAALSSKHLLSNVLVPIDGEIIKV
jgi:hypothetical protein